MRRLLILRSLPSAALSRSIGIVELPPPDVDQRGQRARPRGRRRTSRPRPRRAPSTPPRGRSPPGSRPAAPLSRSACASPSSRSRVSIVEDTRCYLFPPTHNSMAILQHTACPRCSPEAACRKVTHHWFRGCAAYRERYISTSYPKCGGEEIRMDFNTGSAGAAGRAVPRRARRSRLRGDPVVPLARLRLQDPVQSFVQHCTGSSSARGLLPRHPRQGDL